VNLHNVATLNDPIEYPSMDKSSRIYVAGHTGLAGSAIYRKLIADGFANVFGRTHKELDLTHRDAVNDFFAAERPDFVFMAAARVGGIVANDTYPGDFIRENLLLQTHVIDAAYRNGVKKLLFLGSNCIYPKECPQPIKEEYLMTGHLEGTNSAYAVAKIAGIEMCCNAISLMPCNLYGQHDNFNLMTSHVMPGLIRKFHDAKVSGARRLTLWGTGTPRREFLFADDLADAALVLMRHYNDCPVINAGAGIDYPICEVAKIVSDVVGFAGDILFDSTKPDGTSKKLLDVTKLFSIGWRPSVELKDGIKKTYEWFLERLKSGHQEVRL